MLVAALAGLFAFTSSALAKHAGALDRSFGGKGFVLTRPAGHRGHANAVAVGKKDKAVAAGASGGGFGVVRYTRQGRVDSSFGGDGVKTLFGDGDAEAYAVDVGKQGAVAAAGQVCHRHTGCFFAVAKYDSKGRLDKGFGDGGRVELGFGTEESTAISAPRVARTPNPRQPHRLRGAQLMRVSKSRICLPAVRTTLRYESSGANA